MNRGESPIGEIEGARMNFKTTDLYDAHPEEVRVVAPLLRHFGGTKRFCGPIATLLLHDDNQLLREQLQEPGAGRVIVVDAGGSLRAAIIGDVLAQRAKDAGYTGCVIHGCMRDVVACGEIDFGLMALAANPTRPKKKGFGDRGVPVAFGGVRFVPGEWLYADEDGILVCGRALT